MTSRVFKYRLSQQRLHQLIWSAGKGARRRLYLIVLGVVAFVFALVLTSFYSQQLDAYSTEIVKFLYAFLLLTFMFIFGVLFHTPTDRSIQHPAEVNVRLSPEDGGLRFETDDAEHFIRWRGVTKLWVEPDGIVLANYQFFYFIPDVAFDSREEKIALMQVIYDNIGENARVATWAQLGDAAKR
jgi:hypothetical protein